MTHFYASQPTSTIVRRLRVNPTTHDWLRLSWTCPWPSKICPSCESPIRNPSVVPEAQPRALREGFYARWSSRPRLLTGLEFFSYNATKDLLCRSTIHFTLPYISIGTHTTVKVSLQEIVGSDRDLAKVSDVDRRTYLPTVPISSGQSRFGDRNPTSRPTTQKNRIVPICPDQRPKHDFKPAFCLFSLFFSRNSSLFGVFWPFFMYPSVVGRYPHKKSVYIRASFWLKSSFFCHSPLNARNFVYIYFLKACFFLAVKCVESLTKTLKKCLFDSLDFQNFPGGMDPPRKARALPSQ